MNEVTERPVCTIAEFAATFGISERHAYELVKRKEVPSISLGRRILIPRRAIEEMLSVTTKSEVTSET